MNWDYLYRGFVFLLTFFEAKWLNGYFLCDPIKSRNSFLNGLFKLINLFYSSLYFGAVIIFIIWESLKLFKDLCTVLSTKYFSLSKIRIWVHVLFYQDLKSLILFIQLSIVSLKMTNKWRHFITLLFLFEIFLSPL